MWQGSLSLRTATEFNKWKSAVVNIDHRSCFFRPPPRLRNRESSSPISYAGFSSRNIDRWLSANSFGGARKMILVTCRLGFENAIGRMVLMLWSWGFFNQIVKSFNFCFVTFVLTPFAKALSKLQCDCSWYNKAFSVLSRCMLLVGSLWIFNLSIILACCLYLILIISVNHIYSMKVLATCTSANWWVYMGETVFFCTMSPPLRLWLIQGIK